MKVVAPLGWYTDSPGCNPGFENNKCTEPEAVYWLPIQSALRKIGCVQLNREQNDEECDARDDDSPKGSCSTEAGNIIHWLFQLINNNNGQTYRLLWSGEPRVSNRYNACSITMNLWSGIQKKTNQQSGPLHELWRSLLPSWMSAWKCDTWIQWCRVPEKLERKFMQFTSTNNFPEFIWEFVCSLQNSLCVGHQSASHYHWRNRKTYYWNRFDKGL